MISKWTDFLRAQGARYIDGQIRDFADAGGARRGAGAGAVLVDLSHLSLIAVGGADREAFLNGQLTNDVRRIDADRSQLSAWCSPKGRMLALFRVYRRPDTLWLELPAALRDTTMVRLRMYVLRSKVTLEHLDDVFVRLGIAGPAATTALKPPLSAVPQRVNDVVTSGDVLCVRLPGMDERFEIVAHPDQAIRLWTELQQRATPVGADAWTWRDIMAGIPAVLPPTADAFIPQMTNLDLLDAVNFEKGCYTGQEIVARLHYRGRLKQRMYRFHLAADALPAPGDPLYGSDQSGQSLGRVVSAAASPDGGYDLLAVTYIESVGAATLRLQRPDGPPLTLATLPYALPS